MSEYETYAPLVSVLMTVYNREAYIAEAIESVINSSYKNWELIIVDDQSKDHSVEIARKYENQDNRIQVYVNKENLGDYPNRNRAATYARGKYLKYLDADDLIYWYGLEAMVRAMEQFPTAAVGLSHSKAEEFKPYPFELSPDAAYQEHFLGRGVFNYGPTGLIFRRDVFEKVGGFSGERYIGDTELLLRLGAKYNVVKMAPALTWWRQHEGQQIVSEKKNLNVVSVRYHLHLNAVNSEISPLTSKDKVLAVNRLKQHHARGIISRAIKQKDFKGAAEIFRASRMNIGELLSGFRPYL